MLQLRCVVRLIACIATLAVGTLRAQSVETSLALGAVVPTGDYASRLTVGPVLRGAVAFGDPQVRTVRARIDVEAAWLRSRNPGQDPNYSDSGTLRAVSVMASVIVGASTAERVAPYGLAGIGLQRLSADAANPYGTTAGVRIGFGVQWRAGTQRMFAEIAPHWALTDYGTGKDFGFATYVPLVVGVRF
jgi:opacity protein-like surface antigen